jgi:hypothetical protein
LEVSLPCRKFLAGYTIWFDLDDDALLAGRTPGIPVFANVSLRKLVDMRVGALDRLGENTTSNDNLIVGMLWSAMEIATRGSLVKFFFCFTRPSAVFTGILSSSWSIHTGDTCGDPSGMMVAICAKFFPSISLTAFDVSLTVNLLKKKKNWNRAITRPQRG